MKTIDMGYSSHFPTLAAACAVTRGRILELGSGWASTPMLNLISSAMNRQVYTLEGDKEWLAKFMPLQTQLHILRLVKGDVKTVKGDIERWKGAIPDGKFDLAFVDFSPGEWRPHIIKYLINRVRWFICHDTEKDYAVGSNYDYESIYPLFKYHHHFRLFRPYTTILGQEPLILTYSDEWKNWEPL